MSLASDVEFRWNSEEKSNQQHVLQTALNWDHKSESPNIHEFELKFMHPTFEKVRSYYH